MQQETIEALVSALRKCSNDLEDEIEAKYPSKKSPAEMRRYLRDLTPVFNAREAITKYEQHMGEQCNKKS